jgi:hypothetical protein
MSMPYPVSRLHSIKPLAIAALLVLAILATGCAPKLRAVPIEIHSEPPGAYVLMQFRHSDAATDDWLYLGNTPLQITRELNLHDIARNQSVAVRVMREGYFDQTRSWQGRVFFDEYHARGRIFWNPRLVRAQGD